MVVDNETGEVAQVNTVKYDPRYNGHFLHFTGKGYANARHFRLATPAEVAANKPDADGWMISHGGNWHGYPDDQVLVRFADGYETKQPQPADSYVWHDTKGPGRITHYRLAKPTETAADINRRFSEAVFEQRCIYLEHRSGKPNVVQANP